jgi:hypothetical protein
MFLWFAVLSVLGVYAVFRDEAMDYRYVAAGALLPDLIDGVVRRGIGPLHSVVVGVALLFATVAATIGRRALRKRWLAVPIGIFAHQILDGAWADTRSFWWPITGLGLHGRLPVIGHGAVIGVVEELIAAAAAVWMWRVFSLSDPMRRRRLLAAGHLPQQRPSRRGQQRRP